MSKTGQNCLDLMRIILSRRNTQDEDSTDDKLLSYLNNFINLKMPNDIKLLENFKTEMIEIPAGTTELPINLDSYMNASIEAFISYSETAGESISWQVIDIFQNAGDFYSRWGIDNIDKLVEGQISEVLMYGNKFTFRTIPEKDCRMMLFVYGVSPEITANENIPYAYWYRYVSYGACLDYAVDYSFDENRTAVINAQFNAEKRILLNRVHGQITQERCIPRF